ncbi:MAG: hypothetical protein COA79_11345 [Planctomycetota bacterium]|nr:MAG: hypothetical protein COA79_11345 [Planctomycetota bacterium]
MLILFFDTYIVSGVGSKGGTYSDTNRELTLSNFRNNLEAYKWQEKIDVVKYTLVSYSKIKWDKVIIRYECEDTNQNSEFKSFCESIFPMAKIVNERSATAAQYVSALNSINEPDDSWIFFSPNNDHPYIAHPDDITRTVAIADKFSKEYTDHKVSVRYSHFTEYMNDNRFVDPKWGYYYNIFKKILFEDTEVIVTKTPKTAYDSIMIQRLGHLKEIFSNTKNKGRVIRIEDTEFYLSRDNKTILIAPKIELCRHYDSSTPIINKVPPLFIPNGFFENEIKLRYCYDNYLDGWVNINPLKHNIDKNNDLLMLLDDIPFFWKDRISKIDINPNGPQNLNRTELVYYNNILNPWANRSIIHNIVRSSYLYLKTLPRELLASLFIKLGVFEKARNIKNRIL